MNWSLVRILMTLATVVTHLSRSLGHRQRLDSKVTPQGLMMVFLSLHIWLLDLEYGP